MTFDRLDEYTARNIQLNLLIEKAERNDDSSIYDLKRELFQNKLAMIDLITMEETRSGITARELRQLVAIKPKHPRYETGIAPLDEKLNGGVEIGTLVQLAGESFVGKTHLTLEILANVSNYSKTVFFNFEMGDTRIVKRLEALLTNEQQWDNLIIDNDSRELTALCNEITLYAHDGVKFFTIDSKMKIEVKGDGQEYQKFASITKELAKLTQKHDIIIFLINQMSEDDIKNKRLAFKGGGDQKYDSDISLFYIKNDKGERRLICNKNRQDDFEFFVDLKLDHKGRTVGLNAPIQQIDYEPSTMGYVL